MLTKYTIGRNLEYKVIKHLKSVGYETIRSAGSHGLCDIIAGRQSNEVLVIQVKRSNYLSRTEMDSLIEFAHMFNGIPVFVFQKSKRKSLEWYRICPEKELIKLSKSLYLKQ